MTSEWHLIVRHNGMYGIVNYVNGRPKAGIYNLTLEEALIRIELKRGFDEQGA